ncbi:MAG: MFS transporter [Gammaproteobacteria bacterium]
MKQNEIYIKTAETMTATELRASLTLAVIFFLRMLGLFMILPVFALYADNLEGVTPLLIGIALGVYGLTQAIFQIPFGMLSDHIGRKPIILMGLIIFAAGSGLAAESDTILGIIVGRSLQGAGAIAAAAMALAADLTREEQRTKAMAIIGISIGLAFATALVASPILDAWIGVPGIFWLTVVLAIIAIAVLYLFVPQPVRSRFHRDAETAPGELKIVLTDTQLLRLDLGILLLHLILTASFVALPLALRNEAGLPASDHWQVYLPVLILSVGIMLPFLILAEKYRAMKQTFAGAVFILMLSLFGLSLWHTTLLGIFLMLLAFFAAFNFLEASLPSLISRTAPADQKGSALGVYSTSQFLGTFIGGALGGWLFGQFGYSGVFLLGAIAAFVWLGVALSMPNLRHLTSHMINVGRITQAQAQQLVEQLTQVAGVAEAVVIAEDEVAYLKVDRKALDNDALREISLRKE